MWSKFFTLFAFAAVAVAGFPRHSFYIRNVENGKVVTVQNGSIEPGAAIVLTDPGVTADPEQLWLYDSGFLVNVRSGLLLTLPVTPGSRQDRLPVILSGKGLTQEEERGELDALPQLWDENFKHLTVFDPRFTIAPGDDESAHEVVTKQYSADDLAQQWSFDEATYY